MSERDILGEAIDRVLPHVMSPFDRDHIADILAGHGTWFTADLLRLCAHADSANLERIRMGFPDVVDAYLDWRTS